jgi:hypothetical protein
VISCRDRSSAMSAAVSSSADEADRDVGVGRCVVGRHHASLIIDLSVSLL